MIDQLDRAFTRIGARVRFAVWEPYQTHGPGVRRDEQGDFFLLDLNKARRGVYGIQEVRPALSALILRDDGGPGKYPVCHHLCHHDGDRWRLEGARKSMTIEAALRPAPARDHRPTTTRPPRLTFVPAPTFQPADVLYREEVPVHRCRSLGFVAEQECRVEQPPVFVGRDHPDGLSEEAWRDLRARDARAFRRQAWRQVTRLRIYVRGWLWRPDRPLATLRTWHEARISGVG